MRKSFLAVSLGIVATNAMFVVPEGSTNENDLANLLPFDTLTGSQSWSVEIVCPSCPFRDPTTGVASSDPNHLALEFTIDSNNSADRLLLNGFELFPNPPRGEVPKAAQVLDSSDSDSVMRKLGFSSTMSRVAIDDDGSTELVEFKFQVIALGRDMMRPDYVDQVPVVEMRLVKQAEGGLVLASLETKEVPVSGLTSHWAPSAHSTQCQTSMCRLQELISQRLGAIKSGIRKHCSGDQSQVNIESPSQGHGYGHRRHGDRKHRSGRQLLRYIASHILLPIAIGVVAGVSASIIGMIIGTFVVCLWRVVIRPPTNSSHTSRRRHRRGSRHGHKKALDDEKSSLIATYLDNESLAGDESV
jgi:hypothetical protein